MRITIVSVKLFFQRVEGFKMEQSRDEVLRKIRENISSGFVSEFFFYETRDPRIISSTLFPDLAPADFLFYKLKIGMKRT
jgi:hypothetical protein